MLDFFLQNFLYKQIIFSLAKYNCMKNNKETVNCKTIHEIAKHNCLFLLTLVISTEMWIKCLTR